MPKKGYFEIDVDGEPEGEKSAYPDSECRKKVVTCVCPVCKTPISEPHQPDVQCVLEEGLYYGLKTRIVDSEVIIEHQFTHFLDENTGVRMEEYHDLVAVIEARFDSKGVCTGFDIVRLRPLQVVV
jgi:hypothetical protein